MGGRVLKCQPLVRKRSPLGASADFGQSAKAPVPHPLGAGASVPKAHMESIPGLRLLLCGSLCLVVTGSTDHKLDKGLCHVVSPGEATATPPATAACSLVPSYPGGRHGWLCRVGGAGSPVDTQWSSACAICAQDRGGGACPNLGDTVCRFEACGFTHWSLAILGSLIPVETMAELILGASLSHLFFYQPTWSGANKQLETTCCPVSPLPEPLRN